MTQLPLSLRRPDKRGRLRAIPAAKIPPPKELTLHFSVAKELERFLTPGWKATHFPAGEKRDKQTGAKLKRMGLKKGWSDFLLLKPMTTVFNPVIVPIPFGLLHCLELKREGEDLDEDQEEFRDFCLENRIPWACADTLMGAINVLQAWGALRVTISETAR